MGVVVQTRFCEKGHALNLLMCGSIRLSQAMSTTRRRGPELNVEVMSISISMLFDFVLLWSFVMKAQPWHHNCSIDLTYPYPTARSGDENPHQEKHLAESSHALARSCSWRTPHYISAVACRRVLELRLHDSAGLARCDRELEGDQGMVSERDSAVQDSHECQKLQLREAQAQCRFGSI